MVNYIKSAAGECRLLRRQPANWLVVTYQNNLACLTAVPQKATSGVGFLKRTISNRRCRRRFKIYLHARRRAKNNADKKNLKKNMTLKAMNVTKTAACGC